MVRGDAIAWFLVIGRDGIVVGFVGALFAFAELTGGANRIWALGDGRIARDETGSDPFVNFGVTDVVKTKVPFMFDVLVRG